MDQQKKYQIRRHEFPHGQSANMNPGKIEGDSSAYRGFQNSPQTGRDYESNIGYRDNYNQLGIADMRGRENERGVSHRGKGPRSYQRNDDRILEDINQRMCDNPQLDASDIEVTVNNGDVVLIGTVEDRDSKKLAAEIGEEVSGVKNVENRLRVKIRGI